MPNFCDCLGHDLWEREKQLSILRAFAGRKWQPPEEDDGVFVDAVPDSLEEIDKEMRKRPHGKQAILGPGGE